MSVNRQAVAQCGGGPAVCTQGAFVIFAYVLASIWCVCVRVCVCVREREREREKENGQTLSWAQQRIVQNPPRPST